MIRLPIQMAAVATFATMAFIAPASAEGSHETRESELIMKAFEVGLTTTEIQELARDYPETAERVPAATPEPDLAIETSMSIQMALASSGCATVYGTHVEKSITGLTTLYEYRHYAKFCWNGTTVTSLSAQPHKMLNVDWSIGDWSVKSSSSSGVNTAAATSYKQLAVTHCFVSVGCVGKTYPWVQLTMKKDGSSTYTHGT